MKKILIKSITVIGLLFLAPHCGPKSEEVQPFVSPVGSTETKGLDLLNYMRLSAGEFTKKALDKVPVTSRKDLSNSFRYVSETDSNITIYFHGGLIPIQMAYKDPLKMKLDSTLRHAGRFPFYVLYGAGPGNIAWTYLSGKFDPDDEALSEQGQKSDLDAAMENAFKRKSFQYLMIKLLRRFSAEKGSTLLKSYTSDAIDTSRLEQTFNEELKASADKDFKDNDFLKKNFETEALSETMEKDPVFRELAKQDLSPEQLQNTKNISNVNYVKLLYNVAKITIEISKRVSSKRHHCIVMTLTEEIVLNSDYLLMKGIKGLAQEGWGQLKQNVRSPFNKDGQKFGGTALLDELYTLDSICRKKGKPKKICLIGSSTGAIMICELLKASSAPKYKKLSFDLIFSVPACTFKLFGEALDVASEKINSFYMFALSDKNELVAGWPLPYPGTILYFVSGICEKDNNLNHDQLILGMQRFYQPDFITKHRVSPQEKEVLKKVYSFMNIVNGNSKYVVWSNEPAIDIQLKNTGTKHTKVIRNPEVQNSIHYLLTQKH